MWFSFGFRSYAFSLLGMENCYGCHGRFPKGPTALKWIVSDPWASRTYCAWDRSLFVSHRIWARAPNMHVGWYTQVHEQKYALLSHTFSNVTLCLDWHLSLNICVLVHNQYTQQLLQTEMILLNSTFRFGLPELVFIAVFNFTTCFRATCGVF
jgi:hypothetical protein